MAALGVSTDRQLGETNELIGPIRGDENGERLPCVPVEELRDLGGVLGFGVIRPQRAPQAEPGGSVTWCDDADDHGSCLRPLAGPGQGRGRAALRGGFSWVCICPSDDTTPTTV